MRQCLIDLTKVSLIWTPVLILCAAVMAAASDLALGVPLQYGLPLSILLTSWMPLCTFFRKGVLQVKVEPVNAEFAIPPRTRADQVNPAEPFGEEKEPPAELICAAYVVFPNPQRVNQREADENYDSVSV